VVVVVSISSFLMNQVATSLYVEVYQVQINDLKTLVSESRVTTSTYLELCRRAVILAALRLLYMYQNPMRMDPYSRYQWMLHPKGTLQRSNAYLVALMVMHLPALRSRVPSRPAKPPSPSLPPSSSDHPSIREREKIPAELRYNNNNNNSE
jgi:hypothetical protein